MGKPIRESRGEIYVCKKEIEVLCRQFRKVYKRGTYLDNKKIKVVIFNEAKGISGIITPWNFPLIIPISKIVQSLLVGNTVVFKPSEVVPVTSIKLTEVIEDTGLPSGVVNTIIGDRSVGKILIRSPIDVISFTGSLEAGEYIIRTYGKNGKMKKLILELGGNDPFIVLDDANVELAAKTAVWGRFFNCGQVCAAPKRFIIHSKVWNDFLEYFLKYVKRIRIGNGLEENTQMGPLATRQQLLKIQTIVKDALRKNARILFGAKKLFKKGYFYAPTVLEDINLNMEVWRKETFGPVAPLVKFNKIEECITLANKSIYGLGASIWSENEEKALSLTQKLECGTVWINTVSMIRPELPWGGTKQSGIGRELGKRGFIEVGNTKVVMIFRGDKTWLDQYFQ